MPLTLIAAALLGWPVDVVQDLEPGKEKFVRLATIEWAEVEDPSVELADPVALLVAVDGQVAVVRVAVHYDDGQRWRDLWLLNFDEEGRCEHFEEWPFAPDQPDGHEEDR